MNSESAWPIALADVLAARERLRPYLPPTPLRSYAPLDATVGAHVLVKHENHQPTNAFKARNGLAVMTALSADERRRGVVAATRGNHGQGLAWAGRLLGAPVTICVPIGNNPEKNQAMRGLGAELIEEGRDYDEAVTVMSRLVRDRGLRPVHSTNEPLVIAGAATLTLEIVEQAEAMNERLGAMVVAVGGGSQAVGAMTVLRALRPGVPVFGVQASQARAIHDSWHARRPLVATSADTIADGLATRQTYEATFDALREGLADFVLVSEAEIADAVRLMIRATHNLAEPAGAAGLAGLRKLADRLRGQTVGIVLSGGNVDQETLRRIVCGEI
ncbi:MAG: threonine/serine dehydratase [Myxococcota bacterium]